MKKLIILSLVHFIASNIFAQQGSLSLEEEIMLTSRPLNHVVDHLKSSKGFTVAQSEFPPTYSDSTVYLVYKDITGADVDVRVSKKVFEGDVSMGISYTSTDEKWFKNETSKISAAGFLLSENTLRSDTAKDAKIYEKDNYRIQCFWSVYPGSDKKFYTIDVIQF